MHRALFSLALLGCGLSGCLNGLGTAFDPKPPPEVWPLGGKWSVSEQTLTSNPCGARNPLLPDTLTLRRGSGTNADLKVVELDAKVSVTNGTTYASSFEELDFRPQLDCVADLRRGFSGPSGETELQVELSQEVTWDSGHAQPSGCAEALAAYLDLPAYPDAVACTLTATARLTRLAAE